MGPALAQMLGSEVLSNLDTGFPALQRRPAKLGI